MKILIIEDKASLAEIVGLRLKKEGYDVDIVNDGDNGWDLAVSGAYDLIVLDIMLPGIDGFEILKGIRRENIDSKVIILTAKTMLSDKLEGLTNGANDYLTKPFHIDELVARVNVLLEKAYKNTNEKLEYKDLLLDKNKSLLKCLNNNKEVELVKKELQVLEYFINNREQILSKQQIYDKIWGVYNEVESNKLEVYLTFIRRKLKAIDSKTQIKAVRGLGYKLQYINE